MKTHLFVLVPHSVRPSELLDAADKLLASHRISEDDIPGTGKFDYLVGFEGTLNDAIAEGRLPNDVRRALAGCVCDVERLPPDAISGALLTPDGVWHDLSDHGWRMVDDPSPSNDEAFRRWTKHFTDTISAFPYCWVLEYWAHS